MIYLDNAATTGYKPPQVINAVADALQNLSANPGRSGHKLSTKAMMTTMQTRQSVILEALSEKHGEQKLLNHFVSNMVEV